MTGPGELVVFRRLLRRWADLHGMGGHAAGDVVVAVGEVVTNALQHGRPPVRVRAWTADGLARVHVHDRGLAPIPATAGYHRPVGAEKRITPPDQGLRARPSATTTGAPRSALAAEGSG